MQQHMKNLFIYSTLCLALVAVFTDHVVAASLGSGLIVSVNAKQMPLKKVLTEISNQTSWKIVVDERLIDKPISGFYQDIELNSLLKRALKGENVIVLYDEGAKSVDIRSFGGTSIMLTIEPKHLPGMGNQKGLQALRIEEQRVYAQYISNPDSIDPLSGMTLEEINALRAAENKAYQEYISNPDSVDPITGMNLSEIKILRDKEQKAHDDYVSNPDSVDPITGLKLSEIKILRDKEQKAYSENASNPGPVGSFPGMAGGEVESVRNKDQKAPGAKNGKPDSYTP